MSTDAILTQNLQHLKPGSKSTAKQKTEALKTLANIPEKEKWVGQVSTKDLEFISHLLDAVDLSSSTFSPDAIELWREAMRAMSDVATQLRKRAMDDKIANAWWINTRKRFPRMIDQIWSRRVELKLLEPRTEDTRNCIVKVMRLLCDGAESYNDKILKGGLYKYHAFELSMNIWVLDTGTDPSNISGDLFRIYSIIGKPEDNEHALMARFSEGMTKYEIINWCKNMLNKDLYSHSQTHDAMQVVTEMATAMTAFSLWDEPDFRKAVMNTIWRQLKKPYDQRLQLPLSESIVYFNRMMERVWPKPNEAPSQRFLDNVLEPLIADGIIPMFARIMYELSGARPYTSGSPDSTENMAYQNRAYTRMLDSIADACKLRPALISQHVLPIWLHDLNAFRDLDQDTCPGKMDAIRIWTKFGMDLGMDEAVMRKEEADGLVKESNGLYGCSWHRCVMYKDTPQAKLIMMRDTNDCGLVQYCSVRCQKRDWEEGGHKDVCKPGKALMPNGR